MMCLTALTINAQKCAVLEFRGAQSVSVTDIDGISEMFMTYFRPAGYTMVERAQIDKVISEQGFQRSSLTDAQAVKVGRILNVSKVVVGKVSRLGGQYQVDVRVVDVESGHDVALEGATFSGDYRTNVRNLATKLAGKIAITSGGTVNPSPTPRPTTNSPKTRTKVEVLYGYLKIFPNELGTFQAEPKTVIAQINKQAQHGYNNWRIPTNEELSLMRANNYLGSGEYMTRENPKGIVLLVSDGDDYETVKAKEDAERKQDESSLTITVGDVSFEMIKVKAGTFVMGCTDEQGGDCYNDEKAYHRVTLTEDYYIGKFEVTQELYEAVMGRNPSKFRSYDRPVEQVSWNEALDFCTELSRLTGRHFTLPTEAQWEYAARGGHKAANTKYSGSSSIDKVAWYDQNAYNKGERSPDYGTHPVGKLQPNELGVYDMSGNVWEWCYDWYGDYSSGVQTDPKGPSTGSYRVYRGGSWNDNARFCSVAYRGKVSPGYSIYSMGFRLVLVP